MARKKFSTLTEPMFYLLMSLADGDKCGIDVSEFIQRRSKKRVVLGPGTLYALLSDFEQEGIIRYVGIEGKKKTYSMTEAGRALYEEELKRLRQCIIDAEEREDQT